MLTFNFADSLEDSLQTLLAAFPSKGLPNIIEVASHGCDADDHATASISYKYENVEHFVHFGRAAKVLLKIAQFGIFLDCCFSASTNAFLQYSHLTIPDGKFIAGLISEYDRQTSAAAALNFYWNLFVKHKTPIEAAEGLCIAVFMANGVHSTNVRDPVAPVQAPVAIHSVDNGSDTSDDDSG